MKTKIIEAFSDAGNWGKFLVGRLEDEIGPPSAARHQARLLASRGWSAKDLIVFDLETGEGAVFSPGGLAAADLEKHRIQVCPLFLPFLEWLYRQDLHDLGSLPERVTLKVPHLELASRRRGAARGRP